MPASAGVVSFLVVGVLLVFVVCGAVEVASLDAFVAFLSAVLECGLDGGVGVVDVEPFVVHVAGVVAVCCDVSGVLVFPEFEAVVASDGVAVDFPDVFFDGFGDDSCGGVCVGFDARWCSFARFLCS